MEWLDGKKTYIIALATAIIGILQAFGVVLPEWVLYILGGLGIGTIRHGMTTEAAKATEAAAKRP